MLSAHPQSWALRAIRARCKWSLLLCWRDRCTAPGSGHCRPFGSGIGHTARPLPVAVADSPIEAATPDPQHPMCYLWWPHHSEYPRPAAGPSRRPGPTGRYRHRAHGTPAAHCRRRFAHRSGHSRSTVPDGLLRVASPREYPRPAAGPSRRPRPTGRYRHRAQGTPAAHCRRRFAHRSGHSRSTVPDVPATLVPAPVIALYHCRSS